MIVQLILSYGSFIVFATVVVLGVWVLGRREGRADAEQDAADEALDTHRRIDDAEKPADPGAARVWLRNRRKP